MRDELCAGIYRIYDPASRISFIGYTLNLQGILKRFRFELGLNVCTFKPLQVMYNVAGGRVETEILEEIGLCDANDENTDARLKAALEKWRTALEESGEQVRIILL